ncbi:MAG: PAS domain S-box protein, partial [Planctomycetes bacterium]|nr:PAS domain S-box protein [Planctomycetota bacterium]
MVIVFSIVIGLFVCLIDGCLDYFIFYEGTFWGLLISDVPPHEIYDRTIILLAFAAFGVTVSRMMSSRTEADRKLQESEERFRSLFENAPLGHQSLDANGDFVEVNEAWCELLGYTKGEVLGRNFSEFIHPDFREKFKENFPKFESMGYVLGIEFEMVKKDGSEIVVAFDGQIDRRGDGSFKQTHCVLSDVTERKRAEDALRKSEAKFKTAVEQSPEMLFINKRGKIVFANERCEEVMGYARGELASLDFDFRTVVAPECLEMVEANFRTHTDGGEVPPYECALITKNGKRIEAILSSSLIDYEGDTAILGVATDITQRKQAEEALRKSEARFADIAENALEWIWEVDTKGRFTYASPVVKELLGYQPDELLGKHFFDFFHPEDREELKKAAFEAFAQKLPLHEFVNRNVHKTGRTVLLSTSGVPVLDACGNLLGYRGADTDITERNQAEEALRESEERHRVLFESSRDAIMTLAPPSWEFTSGNPASVAMFGARDEAEFTSLPPWKLSPKHQPDGRLSADKAKEMIDTAMQEGSHFFQWTHKTVDSREFPADVLLTRVELAGHSLLQATVRDITERKQVEEVLAERNRKLLKAQEIANFGFIDWDCDTDEITMSEEVQRLYQADPEKIKTGQELLQHAVHPEDLARVRKGLESAARSKTKLNIDHRIQPPDGPVRWVNAQAELEVDVAGNPESLLGSVIDITERKQAEEILRESEQRFRDLAELLPQTVCEADLEGRLTFVNRNALEMFGYSQEDLEAGLSTLDVLAPEERERARRNMERTLRGEDSAGNEYVAQRRDGSRFAVVVYSAPIVRQDRPAGLRAIIVDITDRRRSEDALRESEASNRAILDAIPDMMFRLSRDGTHLDFHAADPKQLYVQPKHILGKTVSDLLPADVAGRYMEHIRRTFANQATQFFEYQLEYPEKEVRYFEARMVPCDDDSVLAIVRDVTERRRAEEEIEHLARFPSENPSPVLRVGEDGVVLYANAAAEPLLSERGSASAEAV